MDLIARVRRFVRRHQLATGATRVAAAVSGGGDSIALVHVLGALHASGDVTLSGLLHLNHQLRAAADRDEAFVREVAAALDLPVYVERVDVGGMARTMRRSMEDAGHVARVAFFERACAELGADRVAVAHTRDDQAETFLLRLVRGAGERGFAGMFPRHGRIVRPLLECRRDELRAFAAARGASWIEDETNADPAIPRNRVRSRLLPVLAAEFNPAIVDVLADEATLAREAWTWMREAADALHVRAVDGNAIDLDALAAGAPPLVRLVLWRAMTGGAPRRAVTFGHVDAVLRLIEGDRDGVVDVPGQRVSRIGRRLVLTGEGGPRRATRAAGANLFRYSLSIPGEVRIAGRAVSAVPLELDTAAPAAQNGTILSEVQVRRDRVSPELAVRSRRPGDRFHPAGRGVGKKLQDYFVDEHVARADRDAVPIVVDDSDRIVWVAGHGIDEAFQVTDRSQGVLLLRLRQL